MDQSQAMKNFPGCSSSRGIVWPQHDWIVRRRSAGLAKICAAMVGGSSPSGHTLIKEQTKQRPCGASNAAERIQKAKDLMNRISPIHCHIKLWPQERQGQSDVSQLQM
jgi:hypothetical protein